MEKIAVKKPYKETKQSKVEMNSDESSIGSNSRSSKRSDGKAHGVINNSNGSNGSNEGSSEVIKLKRVSKSNENLNRNKTSSISDNTSIDEELSCEIAVGPTSTGEDEEEEEEDPVPNIIKEYLSDVSSLKFKNKESLNNNNIYPTLEPGKGISDNRRPNSGHASRAKNNQNLFGKSSTRQLPTQTGMQSNKQIDLRNSEKSPIVLRSIKSANSDRRNYLDMRLTLIKKESIVPIHNNLLRPRTASSLPRRYAYKSPQDKEVAKYPHSLKLLGVQVPEEASTGSRQSRAYRSASSQSWSETPAKVQTRVKRRSVSMDDVKRLIPCLTEPNHLKNMFLNQHQRAVLNQAIYEEWYDKRGKELKIKKQNEKLKKESEEQRKEISNMERRTRNEEVFENWKKKKAKKPRPKNQEQEKKEDASKETTPKPFSDSNAFDLWKERQSKMSAERLKERWAKEKEIKAKLQMEVEKMTLKRQDADNAFEAWLRQKKEKLRQRWNELQKQKIKRQEEEINRRRDAEIAFSYWKKKKEEERIQRLTCDDNRVRASTPQVEEKKPEKETTSGHPTSYEEWLDYVEEREESYNEQMGQLVMISSMKPPWNPGGGGTNAV